MDTFQKACELAAYYQVGDVNGLIEGVAQALAREREAALEEAAKVCKGIADKHWKTFALVTCNEKNGDHDLGKSDGAAECAEVIRALKAVGVNQAT